jgi:CubicO group peptidase (beta-lactamase class C family)
MLLDAAPMGEAVRFARAHETPWPRDLRAHIESGYFERAPDNEILGPVRPRGAPNGLVLRRGERTASWGDTRQVDFTFSVAKSYLSLLAGVAVADGLITDLDALVRDTVDDGGFDGPHNGAITWRHLLQQTSEWTGTLFGKADRIDHNRSLATEGRGTAKGQARTLRAPGTFWEYNDVRVNRLSLALLRRFRRPLPAVFAERIMRPIGASSGWHWHGYRDPRRGSGAHRPIDAATRALAWCTGAGGGLDSAVARARRVESDLRFPVVAEHATATLRARDRGQRLRRRCRRQHHLDRSDT